MIERAHEKVQRTLQEHQAEAPDEVVEGIQRYVSKRSRLMVQQS